MVPHFETVKELDKHTYISSGARNIEKHRNLNFPQLLPIQTPDAPLGHSQKQNKTGLCGNLPTWPPPPPSPLPNCVKLCEFGPFSQICWPNLFGPHRP